ncbi:hypothetical protein HAX54_036078, partial [Datura stramonium]|nr:hypothetical protein [Datura stramonium]
NTHNLRRVKDTVYKDISLSVGDTHMEPDEESDMETRPSGDQVAIDSAYDSA